MANSTLQRQINSRTATRQARIVRLRWSGLVFAAGVTVILAVTLIPILYMVTTSLKTPIEIRSSGAFFPADQLFTENWVRAYRNVPIFRYLFNSAATALLSASLAIVIGLPVSYAIARFQLGGKLLPGWILSTYVTPPIVITIPIFTMIKTVHLIDSIFGLALVHAVASLPVAVWLLESFVSKVPPELDESAWLDGASRIVTLWRIILPVIRPGVVATLIICVVLSWNEFLFALILTYSTASQTFPIGISNFIGEHGQQFGEMSAAALTGLVPVYLLAFFFQKHLIDGLSEGSVKH